MNTQPFSQTGQMIELGCGCLSVWCIRLCFIIMSRMHFRGFESPCWHLNFRYSTCFEQGVLWHSGNYIECGFNLKRVCVMIITWIFFIFEVVYQTPVVVVSFFRHICHQAFLSYVQRDYLINTFSVDGSKTKFLSKVFLWDFCHPANWDC